MDLGYYVLISLLHLDYKMLTNVLLTRLNRHIRDIIHPVQTGFIPGRLSFGNVWGIDKYIILRPQ